MDAVQRLPGTFRRSRSLQSGAGGLRWLGRCCLLPSIRSVWAADTHTHTERKSSGCESAFGQNYIILYLDVDVVSSVICTVFYCEQHQCYLSELFKNTQKNDRILLHKYPKSLCLTRLWASSDLTRVYKARGLSRGETAHCIMQISSQQLYRTLTSE